MQTPAVNALFGRSQAWRLIAAAAIGLFVWLAVGSALPKGTATSSNIWFLTGDPAVAAAALTLMLKRHRFPLGVGLAVALASTVSTLSTGAVLWAMCSIATRRHAGHTVAVAVVFIAAAILAPALYEIHEAPGAQLSRLVLPLLAAGAAVSVGTAVGSRRAELQSLRERAESVEREHAARAAQSRVQERITIAREMHDVLAHRISLVAMQAGVLDHRRDLPIDQNVELIEGIANNARHTLEDLRDVLGVLRAGHEGPEPPQPSLDHVAALVGDAVRSGLSITLVNDVTGHPPDKIGRTCYRVVQEALTNATKHAFGAAITVTIAGTAGSELRVAVRNGPGTAITTRPPVSGFGLQGLTERVTIAGGSIKHHATTDNGHLLVTELPWPSDEETELELQDERDENRND